VVVAVGVLPSVGSAGAVESQAWPAHPNVVLLGDSVTEQAFGYLDGTSDHSAGEAPDRHHLHRWSGTGWTAAVAMRHAGPTPLTSARTNALVVALGPNDAASWDDGWNATDVARWRRLLTEPSPDTCVVVVLPGWGHHLDGTAWAGGMQAMRRTAERLVADRSASGEPTVTVDWLPVVEAHPGYLASDGIHIRSRTAAAVRQALYWDGVARCSTV
jgi:hypothetical protein